MISLLRENFRRTKHAIKQVTATPPKVITINFDEAEDRSSCSQESPRMLTSCGAATSPTTAISDSSTSADSDGNISFGSSFFMVVSPYCEHHGKDQLHADVEAGCGPSSLHQISLQHPPNLKLQLYSKHTNKVSKTYLVHKEIVAFGPRRSKRIADICICQDTTDQGANPVQDDPNALATLPEFVAESQLDSRDKYSAQWSEVMEDLNDVKLLLPESSTSSSCIIEMNEQQTKIIPQLLNFVYFYKTRKINSVDKNNNVGNRNGTPDTYSGDGKMSNRNVHSPATECSSESRTGEMLVKALKVLYECAILFQIPQLQSTVTYELFNDQMLPMLNLGMAIDIMNFVVFDISPLKSSSMLEEDDPLLDSTVKFLAERLVVYAASALIISNTMTSEEQREGLETTNCMLSATLQTLAKSIEPVFLLQILSENQGMQHEDLILDDRTKGSLIAHCVYYTCLHEHPQQTRRSRFTKLTKELLHELTDEEMIQCISPHYDAPVFLLAEAKLRPKEPTKMPCDGKAEKSGRRRRRHGLSRLEKRCIQSITCDWICCYKDYCTSSSGLIAFLHKLPTVVLMEIFMATTVNMSNTNKDDGGDNGNDGKAIIAKVLEEVHPAPPSSDGLIPPPQLTRYRLIDMILQLVMDQVIPKTAAEYS